MAPRGGRTGTAPSGEVEIFYRAFGGGGTPIVIVHGLSYFSYDWIGVAAELAETHEVAAMDMRGFGESGWSPDGDYSVPAMAGDIVSLMDHLGWRRAVLIGHSMGGRNVAYCAARQPDRAAAVVLVDYSPENAPAGARRVTETVAGLPDRFASLEEAMAYFGADPASAPARARFEAYLRPLDGGYAIKRDPVFRDRFRRIQETGERPKLGVDMWEALGAIACPVLALRGAESDMFAPETAERVKESNPRLTLVEVEAGHNIAGDAPAALVREVRAFLDKELSS